MLHNVIAAVAVGTIAGAEPAAMVAALRGFRGLEHVMEPVGEIGGVRFVNDSKATNVEAARRSIESFDGRVVAIVGGQFKGGDLRELREPLVARGADGRGDRRGRAAGARRRSTAWCRSSTRVDAGGGPQAYELAAAGGVVVLAPACASFDWFRDYAERGRVFKEAGACA